MREEVLHRELTNAIRATRREGFRIVQYSVQADHLHLVIEAESASVLSSGMRSFAVRVAMRVNRRVLCRRGRVWVTAIIGAISRRRGKCATPSSTCWEIT